MTQELPFLDPKQHWYPGPISLRLAKMLHAKLTGKKQDDGGSFTSFVRLSDQQADKLIANLKKDPRGYPQLDESTVSVSKYSENLEAYQKWLVSEYLPKSTGTESIQKNKINLAGAPAPTRPMPHGEGQGPLPSVEIKKEEPKSVEIKKEEPEDEIEVEDDEIVEAVKEVVEEKNENEEEIKERIREGVSTPVADTLTEFVNKSTRSKLTSKIPTYEDERKSFKGDAKSVTNTVILDALISQFSSIKRSLDSVDVKLSEQNTLIRASLGEAVNSLDSLESNSGTESKLDEIIAAYKAQDKKNEEAREDAKNAATEAASEKQSKNTGTEGLTPGGHNGGLLGMLFAKLFGKLRKIIGKGIKRLLIGVFRKLPKSWRNKIRGIKKVTDALKKGNIVKRVSDAISKRIPAIDKFRKSGGIKGLGKKGLDAISKRIPAIDKFRKSGGIKGLGQGGLDAISKKIPAIDKFRKSGGFKGLGQKGMAKLGGLFSGVSDFVVGGVKKAQNVISNLPGWLSKRYKGAQALIDSLPGKAGKFLKKIGVPRNWDELAKLVKSPMAIKAIDQVLGPIGAYVRRQLTNPKSALKVAQRGINNIAVKEAILRKGGQELLEKILTKLGVKVGGQAVPAIGQIINIGYGVIEAIVRGVLGDLKGSALSLGGAIPWAGAGFSIVDIIRDIDTEAYTEHIEPNLGSIALGDGTPLIGFFNAVVGEDDWITWTDDPDPDKTDQSDPSPDPSPDPSTAIQDKPAEPKLEKGGLVPYEMGGMHPTNEMLTASAGTLVGASRDFLDQAGPAADGVDMVFKEKAAKLQKTFKFPSTLAKTNVGGSFSGIKPLNDVFSNQGVSYNEEEVKEMMKKMMGKTSANNSNDSENTSIDTTMDNSGGHIGPMTTVSGAQKFTQGMMGDRKFRTRDGLGSGATAFGHTGQDIGMNHGTPLSLGQSGTVIDIGIMGDSNDPGGSGGDNGGYGNFVAIQTSDGGVIKANHLSQVSVRKGQIIQPGQVFGKVGSTGLSTGPHLHIDRGGGYIAGSATVTGLVDPVPWVLAGGILRGGTSNGIALIYFGVRMVNTQPPEGLTKPK